ncbi:Sensor histidine kinase RcsC [uncultured archaeon]|nr:Sensor histidine kinase RcsC [uncultured archaeon]
MEEQILVVDDEPDIADSVKLLLTKMGYVVKAVNTGKDALNILKKQKFDLVLLDILMPEMSGREVLQIIRKDPKLKNQKVAFLTVVELGQAGRDLVKTLKPIEYFHKPLLDLDAFKKRIGEILKE